MSLFGVCWGDTVTLSVIGVNAATIGKLNPLRYRDYVYDQETALYYLQSRYYDPNLGRFLNADALASTGQGLLGNNVFAYCNNNPVNGCDPCGSCFHRWDFWNDCEKCGGKTARDKWDDFNTFVADAWDTTVDRYVDIYNSVVDVFDNVDWEYVGKETLTTGIGAALGGAAVGAYSGYIGVPITAGLSIPACAAVGALTGFVGGVIEGFSTAFFVEILKE